MYQTDNGRVGWDHQIHTSRLPRMIRNHMYTRLYQAPCQLCLTTSLLATDGISHEGPRFFTLVQPWRTSISCVYKRHQAWCADAQFFTIGDHQAALHNSLAQGGALFQVKSKPSPVKAVHGTYTWSRLQNRNWHTSIKQLHLRWWKICELGMISIFQWRNIGFEREELKRKKRITEES